VATRRDQVYGRTTSEVENRTELKRTNGEEREREREREREKE